MILTDQELRILRASVRYYADNGKNKPFSEQEVRELRSKISNCLRELEQEDAA